MNLYWATTKDGFEDWFVVASSKQEAENYHELAEGFNEGDAHAKLICKIPPSLVEKYGIEESKWPSHELIEELGGVLITKRNPRKVNFNGKVYIEGTFSEGIFLNDHGKLTGIYVIKIQNTNKYKIGKTKNLKQRIKQFNTGNPENIKIVYFIETNHYQSFENHLHELFKTDRIGGEWFHFNSDRLDELEANLALLQLRVPDEFKVYNIKNVSIQGQIFDD